MPQIHQASTIFLMDFLAVCCKWSRQRDAPARLVCLPPPSYPFPFQWPELLHLSHLHHQAPRKVGKGPSGHKTTSSCWQPFNNPAAHITKIFNDVQSANLVSLFQPTVLSTKIKAVNVCFRRRFICSKFCFPVWCTHLTFFFFQNLCVNVQITTSQYTNVLASQVEYGHFCSRYY